MTSANTTDATRLSLLEELKHSHCQTRFEDAWSEFNKRYTPMMLKWVLSSGLPRNDAEEICQELMVCLLRKLKTFVYDPSQSFRGWLKTVTSNTVRDFLTQRRRMVSADPERLQTLLDARALEHRIEECFDLEVLQSARKAVGRKLAESDTGRRNWDIFCRLQSEDVTPDQLAAEFGIQRHAVYVARHRVLESLKREVERIRERGPAE
jgi:RNA polymerase sigma-70 factor (ECF subfamily)